MKPFIKLSYYSYCSLEKKKTCVRWVEEYFKDCICNMKDGISFGFGIASLICWGLAEIPQIITNLKNKSADGVSLAFISTWIIGDVFNLVGCVLEPATLPTQFYTAVLYTTTTVVLALQCLYYDHFLPRWKCRKVISDKIAKVTARDERNSLKQKQQQRAERNGPMEVPHRRDFYFMSARSLAGSDTPSQSYMKPKSGPPALEYEADHSSSEEDENGQLYSKNPVSQSRSIPRSAGYGTFLATSAYLPLGSQASHRKLFGRRSLQGLNEFQGNAYGQWLGWLMAAIYMGGRIPQIWLNIKRGSVEGLNPLMFIFALVANATYVGSILVRSTEWKKIKANMPWLLDAVVCVGLDLFIILQYIYYRFVRRKEGRILEEYYGDYKEANKPLVPP